MKNLRLIIAILTATLLSMAAATSGFGMCTDTDTLNILSSGSIREKSAHLQSSVFKLSKDLIDSIHEEGIVAYTS